MTTDRKAPTQEQLAWIRTKLYNRVNNAVQGVPVGLALGTLVDFCFDLGVTFKVSPEAIMGVIARTYEARVSASSTAAPTTEKIASEGHASTEPGETRPPAP